MIDSDDTMANATRLTREGRLAEAVALLKSLSPAPLVVRAPSALPGAVSLGGNPLKRLLASSNAAALRAPTPARAPARPLPAEARFETRRHVGGAGEISYKVYVPATWRERAPLLIMLHGCHQSPDDFAAGTRMNEVAEEHGMLVAYPAQPRTANASNCWNWFRPGDQARDKGEPALIAGATREVIRDFSADAARVYVAGLSAGGAAAAIMGSAYPDIYAAVGVHSGLACGAANDVASAFAAMQKGSPVGRAERTHSVPTIVMHGDRDRTVNVVNADDVIAQATAGTHTRGAVEKGRSPSGSAYTRTTYIDERGITTVEHWLLHGLAHAWSGGSSDGSYADPRGLDASREMVRFFLQHRVAEYSAR